MNIKLSNKKTIYGIIIFGITYFISYYNFKSRNLEITKSNNLLSIYSHYPKNIICDKYGTKSKALLSSRYKDLNQLQTIIKIKYAKDYTNMDSNSLKKSSVTLYYNSNNEIIIRKMDSGVSQNELIQLQKANYFDKATFVIKNLSIIRQRKDLEKVYILARRKIEIFGPGDVAFYDLALSSFLKINTPNLAYINPRDSSEKGYINTFNHITAQALITYFFSENLADLIGDLHERNNMPEITSGRFRKNQLNDTLNSPEDNYIDIINNEIGQKIGLMLKNKYKINANSKCSAIMLTTLLNNIQSYYMWALEIGLEPFRPSDEIVNKFANKINTILYESNNIKIK